MSYYEKRHYDLVKFYYVGYTGGWEGYTWTCLNCGTIRTKPFPNETIASCCPSCINSLDHFPLTPEEISKIEAALNKCKELHQYTKSGIKSHWKCQKIF